MYRWFVKRLIDFLSAILLILVTLPLVICIAIILLVYNRGAVFFVQHRPGLREKVFPLIKFKTMRDNRDPSGNLLPESQRLTGLGKIIRLASLDELPQLFNVLVGHMSLVGPRPLLSRYIPLYSPHQRRRHEVRPGITGWAQVNGRNNISWQQKFDFDVEYVNNVSFLFDLRILWLTIVKVIKREGINESPERPMRPFTGNH